MGSIRIVRKLTTAVLLGLVAVSAVAGCGRHTPGVDPAIERRMSGLTETTELSRTGWTATASATGGTEGAANAVDGTASTRWSGGSNQAAEQWFQVDMGSAQTFNEVTLDSGASTGTFPGAYRLNVSNDGSSWGTPVVTGNGQWQAVSMKFANQSARFIRVTLTGGKAALWTIHEFRVWLGPQPCDACQAGTCQVPTCDPMVRTSYPPKGLLGLWHLDGDGRDASDNANHFTLLNGTTTVHGVEGMAMSLAAGSGMGVSSYWTNDPTQAAGFSFVAWVKPTGTCPGSWPLYERGTQLGLKLTCTGTGAPGLSTAINLGSGFTYTSPVGSVPLDAWTMVAMTWDKQNAHFFINGTETGTGTAKAGSLASVASSTLIGMSSTTSFVGAMDEVAVYARALTGPEVSGLAAVPAVCGTAPKCPTSNPCLDGCNMATNECYATPVPKANGSTCSDGKGCTTGDTCTDGVCSGPAVTCTDPSVCEEATCDPGYATFADSDIVGQWHLDGDLTDASGHGLNLGNGQVATPVGGKVGQGMYFSGSTTSFASLTWPPSDGFNNARGVTLAAWVKPDPGLCPSTATRSIIGRWGDFNLAMKCKSDGTLGILQHFNYGIYNPAGTLPTGVWSHVVLTYDKSASYLYINGARVDGIYPVGMPDITRYNSSFTIGYGAAAAIDEAVIIRRYVTPAEVARMFESPAQCDVHPKTCLATDSCHVTGTCDPNAGGCPGAQATQKPDGTACSDPNVCTSGETCQAGACTGGTTATLTCAAPSGPCLQSGTCDGAAIPTPPQNGLLGWWRFEGDTRDSSGHGLDLKRFGGQVGVGKVGQALEFDGNTCVRTPMFAPSQFDLSHADGVTMMAWVKPNTPAWNCPATSPTYRSIIGKGSDYQMVGACWNGPTIGLTHGLRSQAGGDLYPGFWLMPTGGWVLVATVYDRAAGVITQYVNGAYAGSRNLSGYLTNNDPTFGIGCQTLVNHPELQNAYAFKGTIDEATLYNRALSQAEVQAYYAAANTNVCKYDPKPFGAVCDDGDPGTSGEQCREGACQSQQTIEAAAAQACLGKAEGDACTPGRWCSANNVCHNGVCGGGDPTDAFCLEAEGVVDVGGGQLKALFGYNSLAPSSILPAPNEVKIDGVPMPYPQPAPPAWLPTGQHQGIFRPTIPSGAQHNVSWRANGQKVSATGVTTLQRIPGRTDIAVVLPGDDVLVVQADLGTFIEKPEDPPVSPEPAHGETFYGTLNGSLSVSPMGAATYTLPIAIPPGVAGMAPNLSLVYNSQSGDGLAGQGWELAGLSMIHLCPKTRNQDGKTSAVRLSDSTTDNGLCIDGRRLYGRGGGAYETETKDFSKITFEASSGRFTVVTKSGEKRTYGSHDGSRALLPDPGHAGTQVPAVWMLDRVEDAWGNYFTLQYNYGASDLGDSGILLTQIDYTGHVSETHCDDITGVCTGPGEVDPPNHITLTYEDRPDHRRVRFGTAAVPKKKRLKTITTPAGTYSLVYLPDSDVMLPSRLEKISYCTGAYCLPDLVFEWQGGGYSLELVPRGTATQEDTYELPVSLVDSQLRSNGVQFIDVDGDGRRDLLYGKAGQTRKAWRNNGHGWTERSDWAPPMDFVDANGVPQGRLIVDVDGDGLQDLVEPEMRGPGPVYVHYNRSKTNEGWKFEIFGVLPSGFDGGNVDFRTTDSIVDMNGDGRADLVRRGPGQYQMQVVLNTASGLILDPSYEAYEAPTEARFLRLEDVNRDGLPDLVGAYSQWPDYEGVEFNRGHLVSGTTSAWEYGIVAKGTTTDVAKAGRAVGDVDGDGLMDTILAYRPKESATGACQEASIPAAVAFGTGWGSTQAESTAFSDIVDDVLWDEGSTCVEGASAAGVFNLSDLNADGLADLFVRTGPVWSYFYVNDGHGWKSPDGDLSWHNSSSVNAMPGDPGTQFVDLDGDGVNDLVVAVSGYLAHYKNTFKPPAIIAFPNGLAHKTEVTYSVITTSAAQAQGTDGQATYSEPSQTLEPGAQWLMMPIRVVSSVASENGMGIGQTSNTIYRYESLRNSSLGHGPQGFKRVTVTEQLSQLSTETTYSQLYPYTGMPTSVVKYYGPSSSRKVLSQTLTGYCDKTATGDGEPTCTSQTDLLNPATYPPGTSTFAYPHLVIDIASSWKSGLTGEPSKITTSTDQHYDDLGNAVRTKVTTVSSDGEIVVATTTNDYGPSTEREAQMGKVKQVTVARQKTAPIDPNHPEDNLIITHVTSFDYDQDRVEPLPLVKKKIEPGAGAPLELHTAYDYDRFGNVITTTSCGTAFGSCVAGAAGPSSEPFRTGTVSYRVADFNLPQGDGLVPSLGYGDGRFPVKTTNAEGHSEFSAYDPVSGALKQKTGPNGIHTCYQLDPFGQSRGEIQRCGGSALATTIDRYRADPPTAPLNAKAMTVTHTADGGAAWVYTNSLGKEIETRTRSFDGGFNQTTTTYDALGRVESHSKPHSFGPVPTFTVYSTYDELGRLKSVEDQLGAIDGTGNYRSLITTNTYDGFTIQTTKTVNGIAEDRWESKNVLGKVAWVQDANVNVIRYAYDGDGNLLRTEDPLHNVVSMHYDSRGRKDSMDDPDLGSWSYAYNSYGELVSQMDPKGQSVSMTYDRLGRQTSKTDSAGKAEWVYDVAPGAGRGKLAAVRSTPDDRLTGTCTIPYLQGVGNGRSGKWFTYNSNGDIESTSECVDGETFVTNVDYDSLGRQAVVRYPAVNGSRLAVGYHYTSRGFLQYVTNGPGEGDPVYWKALAVNALGQVTHEQTANGVETSSDRNLATGWLMSRTSTAHADGDTLIQSWEHHYDEAGDLLFRRRNDAINALPSEEFFTYDVLNRVRTSQVRITTEVQNDTFDYDALGNVIAKGGKTFTYTGCSAGTRAAGPHAVCTAGANQEFSYDPNGNMVVAGDRLVTYNEANKPTLIEKMSTHVQVGFVYGADRDRVIQDVSSNGTPVARTTYVGLAATGKSIYERVTHLDSAATEHVQFIYAGGVHGGNAFALRVVSTAGGVSSTAMKYYHFDHLGSVTAMSDETGHVVDEQWGGANATTLGYDVWGARRHPDGRAADPATFPQQVGHREFTGHESIPDVGLVNMNGRVYDPAIGRFLSPDPTIQFPGDLQSYNRYSYGLNNPLKNTDPTGFSILNEMTTFNLVVAIGATAVCLSSGPGCIMIGAVTAFINTALAVQAGAGFDQAVAVTVLGLAIGAASGGIVQAGGDGLGMHLLMGAVSSAASAAMATAVMGGQIESGDLLSAAVMGAASAAASYGVARLAAASQATAADAQGNEAQGGGGSGAAALEASAKTNAAAGKGGSVDSLFNKDRSGLSPQFIKRMQPVFDDFNVDLSDVEITIGSKTGSAYTEGYHVTLTTPGSGPSSYDYTVGELLHELGHVVQFQNVGGATDMARMQAIFSRQFQETQMAIHMYGTKEARYWQDDYLKKASLQTLSKMELLSPSYTLDAQADRFRDVLLMSRGRYGF